MLVDGAGPNGRRLRGGLSPGRRGAVHRLGSLRRLRRGGGGGHRRQGRLRGGRGGRAVANPVGDAPVTAPDVAVLVGSGAWLVEPRPDAGAGPGAGAGDPWKACRMVVPLVLASETGCPMSASATVIAPSARTAATTTAAASAAHLRPRRSPAGRRNAPAPVPTPWPAQTRGPPRRGPAPRPAASPAADGRCAAGSAHGAASARRRRTRPWPPSSRPRRPRWCRPPQEGGGERRGSGGEGAGDHLRGAETEETLRGFARRRGGRGHCRG